MHLRPFSQAPVQAPRGFGLSGPVDSRGEEWLRLKVTKMERTIVTQEVIIDALMM